MLYGHRRINNAGVRESNIQSVLMFQSGFLRSVAECDTSKSSKTSRWEEVSREMRRLGTVKWRV